MDDAGHRSWEPADRKAHDRFSKAFFSTVRLRRDRHLLALIDET